MKILKCLLMIVTAPVILVLTLFVWICTGLIYISGLVLGLLSIVIALLGVAVLITYSLQNGVILLVMAFLISLNTLMSENVGQERNIITFFYKIFGKQMPECMGMYDRWIQIVSKCKNLKLIPDPVCGDRISETV